MQRILLAALLVLLSNVLTAAPWYTGPLLAPAGHTIPSGHTNVEIYSFRSHINGMYNNVGSVITTPGDQSNLGNLVFSHGLSTKMDIQFCPTYVYNRNMGESSRRLGETSATLGYQVLEQKKSKFRPDLRFTIQEIIPTGRYQQLDPINNGTDATGLGSYQTAFNFNFQHLTEINSINYLRTRLSLGYVNSHNVRINGYSSYGGSVNTNGVINLGNQTSIDLAAELNLTQHWVAVMEAYKNKRRPTTFSGFAGTNPDGTPATLGKGLSRQMTLAPAIEYNFNANVGIIAGTWFTLRGKNSDEFVSNVIALNMYW